MISFAKVFLGFCVTVAISFAQAGELNVTLGSVHFKNNSEMNNVNPGVSYTFDSSVFDRMLGRANIGRDTVGAYYNSFKRVSVYGGYYYPFALPESWVEDSRFLRDTEFGVMFGAATGYNNRIGIIPAVLIVGTYPIGKLWGDDHWCMRLTVLPLTKGVATLSATYRF